MFGVELNRCERILDLMSHLAGHLGPCLEAMRAFELAALALQIARHAVEGLDQATEFIRRGGGDSGVEVAASDASGGASQTVDRIRDTFRHVVPHAGAAEDEQQRGKERAAIECLDLLIDFALS